MPPRRAVGGRRPGRPRRQPGLIAGDREGDLGRDRELEDDASSVASRGVRSEPAQGHGRVDQTEGLMQDGIGVDQRQPPVIPPFVPPRGPPPVAPRDVPAAAPVPQQQAAPVQGLDPTVVMQQLITMQGQTVRMLDIMQQ